MKLKDFFNSEVISLPRGGFDDAKGTFDQFLENLFDNYLDLLQSINAQEFSGVKATVANLEHSARTLAASVVSAARASLDGHGHLAYQTISETLSKIDWTPFRRNLREPICSINLEDPFAAEVYSVNHPPLFRIRSDRSEFETLDRGDIFHVPFEKRRLVGNQRYSIAGLPCLYLGSSLWICWEELGRPALDSIWVSRFRIVRPVTVLDFQFPPHQAWRLYEALCQGAPNATDHSSENALKVSFDLDFIKAYLRCWPLIAACSIKRAQRCGSFVPEYIIPQLLLQWVAEEGLVDGIRYFSVRTPTQGNHLRGHSNCVFPVKTISVQGHCAELKKTFALTDPISWEVLTALSLRTRSIITRKDLNAFAPIKINTDLDLQYSQTDFFQIELKLEAIEERGEKFSRTINT
jgi:hypothetical protein